LTLLGQRFARLFFQPSAFASEDDIQTTAEPRARGLKEPLVIAVDLELLAHSKAHENRPLADCIAKQTNTQVIYVSESRNFDGVRVCEQILGLPPADAIVAEGGGAVQSRNSNPRLVELDSQLGSQWSGAEAVRQRLQDLGELVGEHSRESTRRYSCFPLRGVSIENAAHAVEDAVEDLGLDVRVSPGRRIDIAPHGVNTESTVSKVLDRIDAEPESTVVTGSLLDGELLRRQGCWAIATDEIKPEVKANLVHNPRVLFTSKEAAEGIAEGLVELGLAQNCNE